MRAVTPVIPPTLPPVCHPERWMLTDSPLSADTCFEHISLTVKHCLIHPFEREKYLEQSWNTIKSLYTWKLPPFFFFFSCPQFSLTLPLSLLAARRKVVLCTQQKSKRRWLLHDAGHFLDKQSMASLTWPQSESRERTQVKGHLAAWHVDLRQGLVRSAKGVPPPCLSLWLFRQWLWWFTSHFSCIYTPHCLWGIKQHHLSVLLSLHFRERVEVPAVTQQLCNRQRECVFCLIFAWAIHQ